ncbi:hypothetical protein GCM10007907_04100 [Chitinimonas prasina]|uniref:Methyl-accepting transducer domain-containing protein n=1 Tax=Chitinimonas prasina TaxID=1434937 RepID=A0ABQ5YE59_9NEIS|nr:hypothetical protein [Chitinimonas prasina]GLR11620.1 hypothetical protein GCM10007907_04100 [Chitinimonas prasina]
MTVSIAHVAGSTKAAEDSSSCSAELARTGQKLASDATAKIRYIADGVRTAVELVQGLDSRSKEIAGLMGEVTGLVIGVVEQAERAAEYLQRISGSAEAPLGQTRDANLAHSVGKHCNTQGLTSSRNTLWALQLL